MGLIEVCLIGVGLSMDAVAVSMTNGMAYRATDKRMTMMMPVFFGLFQGIMPLLGYFAGGVFAEFLSRYAGICILLILGLIGGKMIYDGVKSECEQVCEATALTMKVLLFQAVATSIDAFAVGVGLRAVEANILLSVTLIALITYLLSLAAIFVGKKFGNLLECKAQILGGVILLAIGVKAML